MCAVIAGLCLISSCFVGCGSGSADRNWTLKKFEDGNFAIRFPSDTKKQVTDTATGKMTQYLCERWHGAYIAGYMDIPKTDASTRKIVIQEFAKHFAKGMKSKIEDQKTDQTGGQFQVDTQLSGKVEGVLRIKTSGNRLYFLVACWDKGWEDDFDSSYFVDSFEILGS